MQRERRIFGDFLHPTAQELIGEQRGAGVCVGVFVSSRVGARPLVTGYELCYRDGECERVQRERKFFDVVALQQTNKQTSKRTGSTLVSKRVNRSSEVRNGRTTMKK